MRETTEKRFKFDALTMKRLIISCIVVPVVMYTGLEMFSVRNNYGLDGHRHENITPRPQLHAAAAEAAEDEEED
jgi:hypothetical protein